MSAFEADRQDGFPETVSLLSVATQVKPSYEPRESGQKVTSFRRGGASRARGSSGAYQ
jgi:hypothetical protein